MKKVSGLSADCRLMPFYLQTLESLSLMFKLRAFKERLSSSKRDINLTSEKKVIIFRASIQKAIAFSHPPVQME